ncbi:SelB C-terminal domain-containing protein, partial [bacterium]|nr:SelB C-terminal domain-containing protein [bacterium]
LPVITKSDLVDSNRLNEVDRRIRERLSNTPFDGSSPVVVSAFSKQSIEKLTQHLAVFAQTLPRETSGGFSRLHIDRVFNVPGEGKVVTGTLLDSSVSVGQTLSLFPSGSPFRIKKIETHGDDVQNAEPFSRTAFLLSGSSKGQIERGMTLVEQSFPNPLTRVDGSLQLISEHGPLKHNTRVEILHGTATFSSRVIILGRSREIPIGKKGFARFEINPGAAMKPFDRCVVRIPTPQITLGGFVILDISPSEKPSKTDVDRLARIETGGFSTWTLEEIEKVRHILISEFEKKFPWGKKRLEEILQENFESLIFGHGWVASKSRIQAALQELSKKWEILPHGDAVELEAIRAHFEFPPEILDDWVSRQIKEGAILGQGNLFKPRIQADPLEEQILLSLEGRSPPIAEEIKKISPTAKEILNKLIKTGKVISAGYGVIVSSKRFEKIIESVRNHLLSFGPFRVTEIKSKIGLSRKYLVPILEKLDELKFTKRRGDLRESGEKLEKMLFPNTKSE